MMMKHEVWARRGLRPKLWGEEVKENKDRKVKSDYSRFLPQSEVTVDVPRPAGHYIFILELTFDLEETSV